MRLRVHLPLQLLRVIINHRDAFVDEALHEGALVDPRYLRSFAERNAIGAVQRHGEEKGGVLFRDRGREVDQPCLRPPRCCRTTPSASAAFVASGGRWGAGFWVRRSRRLFGFSLPGCGPSNSARRMWKGRHRFRFRRPSAHSDRPSSVTSIASSDEGERIADRHASSDSLVPGSTPDGGTSSGKSASGNASRRRDQPRSSW